MPAMAKDKTQYTCSDCGGSNPKWLGKCPHCGAWNTLQEARAEGPVTHRFQGLNATQPVATLSDIVVAEVPRTPTGQDELDRALGGGIVHGGVVLIGGDPGIGKSTLLLQAADSLSRNLKVLYITGEESGAQVALRARRLGLDGKKVRVLAEINLEKIVFALQAEAPDFCVIDSIQTLYSEQLTSAPGSVAQVRECAAQLTRHAKASGTAIVLVGHVTKDGTLAGPRVLEHIVDTVLYFEGDTHSSFRLVRAIKNRFGAVNEIGVFAMTEKGLKGVANPSAIFLSTHGEPVPGSCVLVTLEGTRPLLVEIQALVDAAGRARGGCRWAWTATGWRCCWRCCTATPACRAWTRTCSSTRSAACASASPRPTWRCCWRSRAACAARRCRAASSPSARSGWPARCGPRRAARKRLKEAAKLGFSVAVVPKANAPKKPIEGLTIHAVERIEQAIEAVRSIT